MHIGAYDDEPVTVDAMHRFMEEQGYALDITDQRMHHEIYLSDARRVAPEKLKTVVRHPIKTIGGNRREKDMASTKAYLDFCFGTIIRTG